MKKPLMLVFTVTIVVIISSFLLGLMEGILLTETPPHCGHRILDWIVALFESVIVLLAAIWSSKFFDGVNPIKLIQFRFLPIIAGIALGVVTFVVGNVLLKLTSTFIPEWPIADDLIAELMSGAETRIGLFVTVVILCIISPFAEEVLLRGLYYRILRTTYGVTLSTFIIALLFVVFHPIPQWIPYLIISSIVLCLVFERTSNLFITTLIHSTMNFLALMSLIN